jgi:hypothetical protein
MYWGSRRAHLGSREHTESSKKDPELSGEYRFVRAPDAMSMVPYQATR